MLACARIGAVHSVVFGGFAAKELADAARGCRRPGSILSASCGIEGARIVAYKPLLDEAIALEPPQARGLPRSCSGPRPRRTSIAGRDRDWARAVEDARASGTRGRLRAASRPPTRSTSSTPRARRDGPRGWCATPGGYLVALAVVDAEPLRGRAGRGLLVRVRCRLGRRAIPTSSTGRCCTAAPRSSTRASPWARPDAGAFWRVIAEHGAVVPVHGSHGAAGDQEGGSGWEAAGRIRPRPLPLPVPRRRAGRPRYRAVGRAPSERAGDRPLVADGNRLADRRQSPGARKSPGTRRPAGQARLADRADAGLRRRMSSTRRAGACRPGPWAPSPSGCPCRPAACRPSGRPTTGSGRPTSRRSRAITTPRTPAFSTRTATSTSWAAPTTSSTSRATASPRAAWRRSWPPTRPSPNARSSGSGIALKGEVPCGFVVLKAGVARPPDGDRARTRRRWCARGSARWRPSSSRSPSAACPRPAPARSCAAP